MNLTIKPITYRKACEYVNAYHRHHKAPQGNRFSIACYDDSNLVGVAICGRPIGRKFDDGETLEITRVCTDGTRNACSKLYGACCRIGKEMGYKRIITYILESENGSSVKASNFVLVGKAGKPEWNGRKDNGSPKEYKWLYERRFK